jgi:hypothetical protein|tara:strand:+ start:3062 stop:3172 length:111 start_codon:yes stop_codon:yes gene_type:complete
MKEQEQEQPKGGGFLSIVMFIGAIVMLVYGLKAMMM